MLEVLEQLAVLAAAQSTEMLAQQSFGAVEEVRLEQASEHADGDGEAYYRLRWATYAMGLPGHEINMIVLPEFLAGNIDDLAYFQEQLSAYIVEQVLNQQGDPDA